MDWSRLTFLTCFVFSAGVLADSRFEDYPGLEVVDTLRDDRLASRRIILGSLKKINNLLEPERVEYVTGARQSTTAYIPIEQRTGVVRDFYRDQLLDKSEILFECSGRTCGSSNYWANTVFATPILYGPEQFQHYLLARFNNGDYIAIYVARRGTRKLYVHFESTTTQRPGQQIERFVFHSSDAAVGAARKMLEAEEVVIHLVVHQGLKEGEQMDDAISRSAEIGREIKQRMADSERVVLHGLGALAPDDSEGANRIELLLIRR